MSDSPIILNEREARRARSTLSKIERLLSAQSLLDQAKSGLATDVIEMHQRAISADRAGLERSLNAYERARTGDFAELLNRWRSDPGVVLIIARIARGMSQAELADQLEIREQQIQRYEAERYRSISLQNYGRFARALGVELHSGIQEDKQRWIARLTASDLPQPSSSELRPIVDHATRMKWFGPLESVEDAQTRIVALIRETNNRYGNPALLRTGLSNLDLTKDFALAAWRARVITKAETLIEEDQIEFDPLDISWLRSLVKLSPLPDGPKRAASLLLSKGIVVIIEPHIKGLRLDGAAFLVDGQPIVGLTLRNDRIDNFWYTLLHELAHIILHRQSGLAAGFCDDLERDQVDELEKEANEFASSVLISPELWRSSPARIAKTTGVVEAFSSQIGIHPAIVFGRLRNERKDYKVFSDQIGLGQVRKQFLPS